MAYRRGVTARAKLLYQQQQRVIPSFSHIHLDENDRESLPNNPICENPEFLKYFHSRCYGSRSDFSKLYWSRNLFQDRRFVIPPVSGLAFARNMSSTSVGDAAAEKIEIMTDVADAFGNKTVELASQTVPVVNEVAVAASDSFLPVAALQYLVDYVHSFTGFGWWASIAVTTLLIRCLQVPLMINQLKATTKTSIIKPQLDEIKKDMENRGMSPEAVAEGRTRMKMLFKESGVTPFTPLKGLLISGPIFCSFFFAIRNMVDKVPSFKDGGALWFTDLTATDSMYIFPILTALIFWITVECNAQEGMEGNASAKIIKNVCRGFAALSIPLTASFPQAIFCYWITSNLFSLSYGLVIKRPKVKKFLGIPELPVPPPSTDKNSGFSFFEAIKKYSDAQKKQLLASSSPPPSEITSNLTNQRIPSTTVLDRRMTSLEKEVRGRKKGKKRR
ncbi:mitochondrial inner membrane protein OXA1-like [Primulina eburnea]|uniref:mitochondrial inner membrane protein OXA1-like n=1 Tax=Primulina eburnea TaxID=1245227 RepID=UPI003C6C5F57